VATWEERILGEYSDTVGVVAQRLLGRIFGLCSVKAWLGYVVRAFSRTSIFIRALLRNFVRFYHRGIPRSGMRSSRGNQYLPEGVRCPEHVFLPER
jgi:hypothetical protein